jgi:hypothetical protein
VPATASVPRFVLPSRCSRPWIDPARCRR